MAYKALLTKVVGRGVPPVPFLDALLSWAKTAPEEIFAPNSDPEDVYSAIAPVLGPWQSPLHRRAAMCELLRCLGGFEASWHWTEGVDATNKRSQENKVCQEAGIFQVSFDALNLDTNENDHDPDLHRCVLKYCGDGWTVDTFINMMKTNHVFALEFAARLLRNSYKWDGPIKRGEILSSLKREAVDEWLVLLA